MLDPGFIGRFGRILTRGAKIRNYPSEVDHEVYELITHVVHECLILVLLEGS